MVVGAPDDEAALREERLEERAELRVARALDPLLDACRDSPPDAAAIRTPREVRVVGQVARHCRPHVGRRVPVGREHQRRREQRSGHREQSEATPLRAHCHQHKVSHCRLIVKAAMPATIEAVLYEFTSGAALVLTLWKCPPIQQRAKVVNLMPILCYVSTLIEARVYYILYTYLVYL